MDHPVVVLQPDEVGSGNQRFDNLTQEHCKYDCCVKKRTMLVYTFWYKLTFVGSGSISVKSKW